MVIITMSNFTMYEAACTPSWYVLSFKSSLNELNGRTGCLKARYETRDAE